MVNLQRFVSRQNSRDRKSKIVLFSFLIDFDVLHSARCWLSAAPAIPAMVGLLYWSYLCHADKKATDGTYLRVVFGSEDRQIKAPRMKEEIGNNN